MSPESLDHFFDLLIESLNAVAQEYLYTVYGEMDQVVGYIEDLAQQRNILANMQGSNLYRTGERIFCYELYHQLRIRMERFPQEFQGVYLQGELRKYQVPEMIDRIGLILLSADFIPDFLLHSPGNANDHPFVIEVKTDYRLNYRAIFADVSKIVEFLSRYDYQRGVFICTRISFDWMCHLFRNCWLLNDIPDLTDYAPRIMLVNREREETPAMSICLSQVLPNR